jgi:rubredoxin/ferredoxin-NADP reductase
LLKFRREFWILMAVFAISHWIWAFMMYKEIVPDKTYFDILTESYIWDYKWYLFWWIIATILTIPLLITSNWISVSIMWKHWKTLQRLSYIIFPAAAVHIAIIDKKHIEIGPLIVVWIWVILWFIAYLKNKKKNNKSTSIWLKRLCVPCWYIYDENVWDPDSWIPPWTKFEDIPDNWRCPVCWVWKSDFVLLEDGIKINEWEIVSLNYLTPDVIELKLDLQKDLKFISWQFLTFVLNDDNWKFQRSYSIANKEGNIYTFLIKLKYNWRSWAFFKTKKVWDKIWYTQISWNFNLKNTLNPKIFIATWAWLSTIYNMILNTPENVFKRLYFWVSNKADLFYIDKLKEIKNLELKIFVSREEVPGCHFWRIDLSNEDFEKNSEFYICWNSSFLETSRKVLTQKWFDKVYFEEF